MVGTREVTASSNTAKQRFADISPNCASKAKSMTPSGKIAAKSPRCRIASRSTPHGENVPKFQYTTTATSAATTATNRRKVRTDRSALRAKLLIRVSGDFRTGTLPNCGLRPRSLLYCRGKISKNLTTGELPKAAMRLGFAQGSDPRLITPT